LVWHWLVLVARGIWTGLLLIGFGSGSNQNQIGLVFCIEEHELYFRWVRDQVILQQMNQALVCTCWINMITIALFFGMCSCAASIWYVAHYLLLVAATNNYAWWYMWSDQHHGSYIICPFTEVLGSLLVTFVLHQWLSSKFPSENTSGHVTPFCP
jgi:hypothetical protein